MVGNELHQKFLELPFGAMNTVRQSRLAQNAEEAFHHVDPGGMGRRMVKVHARISPQPSPGGLILVNVQVVQHPMQVALRKGGDDVIHEMKEVDRGAPLLHGGQDLAGRDFQSHQQGLGAMTDILVGPTPGFLGPQRDTWKGC